MSSLCLSQLLQLLAQLLKLHVFLMESGGNKAAALCSVLTTFAPFAAAESSFPSFFSGGETKGAVHAVLAHDVQAFWSQS